MKYEWRKEEKAIYQPSTTPSLVVIPKSKYICIKGKGNPNLEDFKIRVSTLFALSYAIRMMPKKGIVPDGYYEYTVYPLEGLWDLSDRGRGTTELDKNELVYKIMIKQPSFVNDAVFIEACRLAQQKKGEYLFEEATFETLEDGLSVQVLHLGPFDQEASSFSKMKQFMDEKSLGLRTLVHREIYLTDTTKVTPDQYKTILRYRVAHL